MKTTIILAAFLATALPSYAVSLEAYLIQEDETYATVFLEAADEKNLAYRETRQAIERKVVKRSSYESLYMFEPLEFREAMDSFRRQDYEKAREQFKKVQEDYKNLRDLPNDFASRAEFYECECLRHMGKYAEMLELKSTYRFKGLKYANETRQLELYKFWEAYHNKSWNRLATLGAEYIEKEMPGHEMAQVAFCYGMALAELQQMDKALNALGMAVTADFNPRKELSRIALVRSLKLLSEDPDFKREKAAWGTEDALEGSIGQARILEAARIVKYYNSLFATGPKLDSSYLELLKYLPK